MSSNHQHLGSIIVVDVTVALNSDADSLILWKHGSENHAYETKLTSSATFDESLLLNIIFCFLLMMTLRKY